VRSGETLDFHVRGFGGVADSQIPGPRPGETQNSQNSQILPEIPEFRVSDRKTPVWRVLTRFRHFLEDLGLFRTFDTFHPFSDTF